MFKGSVKSNTKYVYAGELENPFQVYLAEKGWFLVEKKKGKVKSLVFFYICPLHVMSNHAEFYLL